MTKLPSGGVAPAFLAQRTLRPKKAVNPVRTKLATTTVQTNYRAGGMVLFQLSSFSDARSCGLPLAVVVDPGVQYSQYRARQDGPSLRG